MVLQRLVNTAIVGDLRVRDGRFAFFCDPAEARTIGTAKPKHGLPVRRLVVLNSCYQKMSFIWRELRVREAVALLL